MKLPVAILLSLLVTACASYRKGPDLWTSSEIPEGIQTDSMDLPSEYRVYRFEVEMLRDALKDVGDSEDESLLVQLPDPDDNVGPFKVWQSGVVTKQMARKYPHLIAYKGFRTSDVTSRIRMELPKSGMHVMVISEGNTWFISPLDVESDLYMVYRKDALSGVNSFWEGKTY